MDIHHSYLFLLAPLHTGGATQEGNVLGIAREVHTELPYIPSSTIRGRLRASVTTSEDRKQLFGASLKAERKDDNPEDYGALTQGAIWIGDGSLLWLPVSSLSHGVVWVSSPLLLHRWAKLQPNKSSLTIPPEYSTNLGTSRQIYLKDAILPAGDLQDWRSSWESFRPKHDTTADIDRVLVLPDRHFQTLVQMALARQVKVKLGEEKQVVDGSFRYEEAIPRDTLMYFPWGLTTQATAQNEQTALSKFTQQLDQAEILQIGGQESLGRGFVEQWRYSSPAA
jgi:CRISPR-associated protein Cmr4